LQAKLYYIYGVSSDVQLNVFNPLMFQIATADYGFRYVVHVLRIGEAITLSLKGSASATDDFEEMRPWRYQSKNPFWHLAC